MSILLQAKKRDSEMPTTIEFTPMSKEKWVKALLSTDPSEKTNAAKVLKAGAAHAGMRGIQAFISKTVEEKADIIWEYQQEVNPYEADGAEETTEEEAPKEKKKRRTIKRGSKAKAKEEPEEEAEDAPDEEEEEEKPKAKRGRPPKAKPAEVDLGPVTAQLNALKEQQAENLKALETMGGALEKALNRLSELDKWVKETHCVLRIFALTSEGVYDNLTNSVVVEELYGKSAFDEEPEGNE